MQHRLFLHSPVTLQFLEVLLYCIYSLNYPPCLDVWYLLQFRTTFEGHNERLELMSVDIHCYFNAMTDFFKMPRPSRNHVCVCMCLCVCVIYLDAVLYIVFGHVQACVCQCVVYVHACPCTCSVHCYFILYKFLLKLQNLPLISALSQITYN